MVVSSKKLKKNCKEAAAAAAAAAAAVDWCFIAMHLHGGGEMIKSSVVANWWGQTNFDPISIWSPHMHSNMNPADT